MQPRILLLFGALLVVASTACAQRDTSVGGIDPTREYLEAKARLDQEAKSPRSVDARAAFVASALRELESRARSIIGPVAFTSDTGAFSLGWLPSGDPSGWVLDGLVFSDTSAGTDILVTTSELIAGWLRQIGDTSTNPLRGLAAEDVLTWAFWKETHVYPYVDILKTSQLPKEVVLAQLVARGNDVVRHAPDELIVAVQRGSRVYLISARAPEIPVPAECDRALDAAIKKSGRYFDDEEAVFLSCYARLGPRLPEFSRVVAHIRQLAARFR